MSQHLPTSISYTKLEIATYIHEIADKLLPSTTSQYILLGTTQLAPNTTLHYNSQYYFVLQNLHKVLPSTTLYYKACTKSFPVCYNLLLQNRISTPKQEKDDFEAFFKRNFKRKITSAKFAKICWQMTIAAWMQPLQYDLQSSAAKDKDNSITHAAAAASNLEAATPMRSATGDSKTPYNYAHTTTPKAACSHRYNAAKKNDKPTAAATVAHTRYLSSSPAATLHGKTQGFVLRLPPQNIAHATSCSHYNAVRSINSQTCTYLRTEHTPEQQMTRVMQPFQCDLQPEIPKQPITTHTQPHPKQLQATVTLRQKKNDKPTAGATVARTRYLSSSPAATLHGKTQGFVLRLPPQNITHATSCSHSNAIWNRRFQNSL